MSRSAAEDFGSLFLNFLIIAMVLVIALVVTWFAIFAIPIYLGFRVWKESPKRLERLAREETMILYDHAVTGSVNLSELEIEDALVRHWPPDLPASLRIQMLDLGKAIFEQEGLSPNIPPPPALCNTVEGARYRDLLAKAGQARNDIVMVLEALDIIGNALALLNDNPDEAPIPEISIEFEDDDEQERISAKTE